MIECTFEAWARQAARRATVEAVLFDLDGVLVDSMALVERHLREWAAHHALDADRVVAVSHGRRDVEIIRELVPYLDVEVEAQRIHHRGVEDVAGIAPVAGALELVDSLPPDRWAVVTSGVEPVARRRLEAAGICQPRVLIAAGDVTRGKPDPEGYLLGAELLGKAPSGCIVFEDAPSGAAAARRAGMRVVRVGKSGNPDLSADFRVVDLRGVRAALSAGGQLELSFSAMRSRRAPSRS